jgi:hypothetical protein
VYGGPPSYGGPQGYGAYPQQPMSYPGGGYDPGMRPSPGWSGLAIGALVAGCIPWIGILAAIPLGVIALVRIGKTGQRGKPLAILGIIISVVIWAITILLIVVVAKDKVERSGSGEITSSGRIDFADIRTGDCVNIHGLGAGGSIGLFDLKGVPCSQTHNAEAAGTVAVSGSSYPGFDTLTRQAQQRCASLESAYVDPSRVSDPQPYLLAPNEGLWKSSDSTHHIVCFVVSGDYSDLDGSVAK